MSLAPKPKAKAWSSSNSVVVAVPSFETRILFCQKTKIKGSSFPHSSFITTTTTTTLTNEISATPETLPVFYSRFLLLHPFLSLISARVSFRAHPPLTKMAVTPPSFSPSRTTCASLLRQLQVRYQSRSNWRFFLFIFWIWNSKQPLASSIDY